VVSDHFEGHPIYVGTEFGNAEDSGIAFQLGYAVIPLCIVQFGGLSSNSREAVPLSGRSFG